MYGPYIQKTVVTGVVISTGAVFRVCGGEGNRSRLHDYFLDRPDGLVS